MVSNIKGNVLTYTGNLVNVTTLGVDDVNFEDIAVSLSNTCRFVGHIGRFYSNAQHSLFVAALIGTYKDATPMDQFQGLLHDGSEAYLSDIMSPIKELLELAGYRKLEKRVQGVIYEKFSLPAEMTEFVKKADSQALHIEGCLQTNKNPSLKIWTNHKYNIQLWSAKKVFKKYYHFFDVLLKNYNKWRNKKDTKKINMSLNPWGLRTAKDLEEGNKLNDGND
jgi:uncharacterized protein